GWGEVAPGEPRWIWGRDREPARLCNGFLMVEPEQRVVGDDPGPPQPVSGSEGPGHHGGREQSGAVWRDDGLERHSYGRNTVSASQLDDDRQKRRMEGKMVGRVEMVEG